MLKNAPILLLMALLALLAVTSTVPAMAEDSPFSISGEIKVTKVVDGDSLRSGPLKIRLHGIDAPERKQKCRTAGGEEWPCGTAATNAMKKIIGTTAQLACTLLDVDRYGRLVMRCRADGTDIAETLVAEGLALAYRRYSANYVAAEEAAERAMRGLWQGRFEAPWDWRRKN